MNTYFIVNSKEKVNLQESEMLLFGNTLDFRNKVIYTYPAIIKEEEGFLVVKSNDSILQFHYGTEYVIEKFVIVDVLLTDEPTKEIGKFCVRNNWHLFDLDSDAYIDLLKAPF